MPEQKPFPDRSAPVPRRPKREVVPRQHAQADGLQLRSYDVGALPLLQRIVERMQLRRILSEHLPRDDSRTELPTVTALLVLFTNLLMAREPVYGVAEWAALFPPDLLGLREQDLSRVHDDRLGRSLDRMFEGIGPTLIMAVVRHVIREFQVGLEELHNDSTTVSFYGASDEAGQDSEQRGRPTHAITWGHSKARRPDLKQLLGTDLRNGVNFDHQDGSAIGGQAGCDEVGAYANVARHAVKCAEWRGTQDGACRNGART